MEYVEVRFCEDDKRRFDELLRTVQEIEKHLGMIAGPDY